jgi:hypothetical protein
MYISVSELDQSGSIDMVGMILDKLFPSFTFPIPYIVAKGIQEMGRNK